MVLAFEGADVGRRMLAWAAQYVLFPDDEVFVVHCNKARTAAPALPGHKLQQRAAAKGPVFLGASSRGASISKLKTGVLRGECRCRNIYSARRVRAFAAQFKAAMLYFAVAAI